MDQNCDVGGQDAIEGDEKVVSAAEVGTGGDVDGVQATGEDVNFRHDRRIIFPELVQESNVQMQQIFCIHSSFSDVSKRVQNHCSPKT